MFKFVAIFLGGGLGATCRYLMTLACSKFCNYFPIGTLSVNIIGSFIMGFGFLLFMEKIDISNEFKLLLTVGFCGGLTTFSTFSLDVWNMFFAGEILKAVLYILLSIILSLGALFAGVIIAKQF